MTEMRLAPEAEALNQGHGFDFSDLRAVYINCTLTKSPQRSHTQTLADRSIAVMRANGVTVESIRAVDHDIAPGVWPDMTEHGFHVDEWPTLFDRVLAADILVLCTPNRTITCASSAPMAPPPSTTREAGSSLASTIWWFVQ